VAFLKLISTLNLWRMINSASSFIQKHEILMTNGKSDRIVRDTRHFQSLKIPKLNHSLQNVDGILKNKGL
jgi:hypothetical protein